MSRLFVVALPLLALAGCVAPNGSTLPPQQVYVMPPQGSVVTQGVPGTVVVMNQPPPAQYEVVPPAPQGYGAVAWQPGHWNWNGSGWAWQPGQYMTAQSSGLQWIEGKWTDVPGAGWRYIEGHWS